MTNHTNGRPDRLFLNVFGHRVLTLAYRQYLQSIVQICEEEERAFLELGIHLTDDSRARIEDYLGTAAFIEGGRA